MKHLTLALVVLAFGASVLGAEPPKKLLLVCSGPDGHPVATHEYAAGVRVLAKCLESTRGLEVTIAKAEGPWKDGPDLVGRSDAVLLFVSEGAKWLSTDRDRLTAFQQLAKRGGGLSVLHWGMGSREAEPVAAFTELFGACHGGPDRKYQVIEKAAVTVADAKHPAAVGIKDFAIREEFYYKLKRPSGKHAVKPLLTAKIDGAEELVAWTWERPDHGRSFGFTGMHFHDNWKREEYRRLVAQGVLWTLKLPIPDAGLNVAVPDSVFELSK